MLTFAPSSSKSHENPMSTPLVAAEGKTDLIKLPADQLLAKFGSGGHKPGSGSAAALLGLLSCKLIQTVVTLSNGRSDYQGVKDQLTLANQDVTSDIEPILLHAVEADSTQFDRVIMARRLRDSEVDPKRKKVLAENALAELREATEIPISIAENCLKLAEKALTVFDLGFRGARGDSGVAISSALSGASGSISIIYLNLTSFKGSEWAIQTRKKADDLAEHTHRLQSELVKRLGELRQEVINREPDGG